jgi:hypothetical protein
MREPSPQDTVILLTEQRSGTGRVHEIGSRAGVLERRGGEVVLQLGDETLVCRAELVAERRGRRPRPGSGWRRPPAHAVPA